jgi:uncharacterized membrane protein YbaN (DUF454 family)
MGCIVYLCGHVGWLSADRAKTMLDKINLPKPVWIVFGFLFTGMGIAGFILPMMPGLVFFILASFCFAKSSPRMLRKILAHPQIGPQIMDWKRGKGMRMKTKVLAILLVTISLSFSAIFMVKLVWVKWIIFFSILAINAYILSVKTRKSKPAIVPIPQSTEYGSVKSLENTKEVHHSSQVSTPRGK